MNIRFETLFGIMMFCVLVASLFVMDKSLFIVSDYTGTDGFYEQMRPFLEGVHFSSLEPLQYIHFLRFLVVSPFIVGDTFDLGALYYAIVIFIFSFPILKSMQRGNYIFLKYVILLIPIVISFRGFLAACAIAYLFIALFHHRSYLLLLFSLFVSTLSSGVVLVWFLVFVINITFMLKEYRFLAFGLLGLVTLVFLPSVAHKLDFASSEFSGLQEYLFRGTIIVSFIEDQWSRFVFYIACILLLLSISIRSVVPSLSRTFYFSYATVFVGAMFEGLGLICGLIITIMFFSGFRPDNFRGIINQDKI